MRIKFIELTNYRPFKSKARINFSPDKSKNFTVIEGANGSGKSNLVNAIIWCLYGVEEYFRNPEEKAMGIINTKVMHGLRTDQTTEASVRVVIDKDGETYDIVRTVDGLKSNTGSTYTSNDTHLNVLKGYAEQTPVGDPEFVINKLLPITVKDFFFFDGEKLDKFFKEETSENVRRAILDVSQMSILESSINHTRKKRDELEGTLRNTTPKAKELMEKMEAIRKAKEANEKTLEDDRRDKTKVESEIKEINEKLKDLPLSDVKKLQSERLQLEGELDSINNQLDESEAGHEIRIVAIAPFILAKDAIVKTLKIADDKRKKGELPPKYRGPFIQDLLKNGKCICGTDIAHDHLKRHNLEKLLEEATPLTDISDAINAGTYTLLDMEKQVQGFISESDQSSKTVNGLRKQQREKQERLGVISEKLKRIKVKDINETEEDRSKLSTQRDDLIARIARIEAEVERAEAVLIETNKDYLREVEKEKGHAELLLEIDMCGKVESLFAAVHESLLDKIKKDVEERTKEHFLNLIWKKQQFVDVTMNENYEVSVHNSLGDVLAGGDLSAGEREVLALSFLAALRDVSGFDFPIMIDTPLARISGKPRENIAEMLPKYLKNVQVMLLVTDTEFDPKVRATLKRVIGNHYKLEHDESEYETKVIEA
jgi:DNA sulfur modification protein DndD